MNRLDDSRPGRLDVYTHTLLPDVSRASIQKIISQGKVTVNGAAQTKAGYKLKAKDRVEVEYQEETQSVPIIEVPIIYEDKTCVVIDKPAGILTHSKGAFNPEATVATWLASHLSVAMQGERAGIVHRLDRATSGVMICAKTPEALQWLEKQFSQRKVKKTYIAVVQGALAQQQAIIDIPIERNPKRPQTFRVGSNGKPAVTEYKVLQANDSHSLIGLQPTTGRTHQLRVHLQHLGHPILGDTLYGGPPADRLFLHAQSLEITLLNKQHKTFSSPLPQAFQEVSK